MAQSLNVIALISGGKDSFFSLLHCLQNGHKVIALGNLYPPPPKSRNDSRSEILANEEEGDLNSFMYQTVGHQVIPLYSEALDLPLYRQEIQGTAVVTDLTYAEPEGNGVHREGELEETESLIPLLRRIMTAHPEANALSTGAILSTYQRTRIESIALRLGLTPLSYLWQYSFLPGHADITLLQDMAAVSLDARIVKVASGGLDESFLWENVASMRGMARLDRVARRFGVGGGGGAVMGEGGEYETLVLDGPDEVFKGRIVVADGDKDVVREGGGAAWLRIKRATVVMKVEKPNSFQLPQPKLLEPQFERVLGTIKSDFNPETARAMLAPEEISRSALLWMIGAKQIGVGGGKAATGLTHWTFDLQSCAADGPLPSSDLTLEEEMTAIVDIIRKHLNSASFDPRDIAFAVIVLRSMQDFGAINKIYGTLFPSPNPPARVTVACGDVLLGAGRVIINLTLFSPENAEEAAERKGGKLRKDGLRTGSELLLKPEALHVQSRSYWAPTNVGPYSQAISIPLSRRSGSRNIYVAGQIPLVPATMALPAAQSNLHDSFCLQATLSLQHLWQIGREMNVKWWTGAIAFLPNSHCIAAAKQKSIQAGNVWLQIHDNEGGDEDGDEVERDLWEEKHHFDLQIRGTNHFRKLFPDSGRVESDAGPVKYIPPFFAAEVEELPRKSSIEWQAILGLSGEFLRPSSQVIPSLGTVYKFKSGKGDEETSHFIVAIPLEFSEICQGSLQEWHQGLEDQLVPQAAYLDVYVKSLWVSDLVDGVVPCRSLWDSDGSMLAAIVVYMK